MTRVLEPRRRALIRKYRWGFAIKRASIAADEDQTEWGDLNRFSLPNDFLRLLRDKDSPDYRKDWKREGEFIVTTESAPLQFRYLADITETVIWDSLFYEALAHDMAHETCKEITGSTSQKEAIKDDLATILAEARQMGAFEEDPQEALDDDYLLARL